MKYSARFSILVGSLSRGISIILRSCVAISLIGAMAVHAQSATPNWVALQRNAGGQWGDLGYTAKEACQNGMAAKNQVLLAADPPPRCPPVNGVPGPVYQFVAADIVNYGPASAYNCMAITSCAGSTWDDGGIWLVVEQKCGEGYRLDPTLTFCAPILGTTQSLPNTCLWCGQPIAPLTGQMVHRLGTGISLGGRSLTLLYNTGKWIASTAGASVYADSKSDVPSFGALWLSSFHKKMVFQNSLGTIDFYRGDGQIVSFTKSNGVYFPADPTVTDEVTFNDSGYYYKDQQTQTIETYNGDGRLMSWSDASGNVLTFVYSTGTTPASIAPFAGYLIQVQDAVGRSVSFTYTLPSGASVVTGGLVNTITDSAGQVTTLAYDGQQNMVSLTWPGGKSTQLRYENTLLPWALTGLDDELNNRQITWAYDTNGRATQSVLAGGAENYRIGYASNTLQTFICRFTWAPQFQYWLYACDQSAAVNSPPVITDPNSTDQTLTTVQVGNSLRAGSLSQPAGSGSAASNTVKSYDASGNVLSNDDASGNRTCYAYDSRNRETVRVEGLATSATCSGVLPQGAALPSGARKTETAWHPDWRLPSFVRAQRTISATVYHGQDNTSCSPASAMVFGRNYQAPPFVCARYDYAALDPLPTDPSNQDPQLNSVTLLLHGDGPNGAKLMLDSSPSSKLVSAVGQPVISTAQSKFGGSSIYLDGSSYLQVANSPDFDLGSGDFTIEFWAKPTTGIGTIAGIRSGPTGWMLSFGINNGSYYAIWQQWDSGTAWQYLENQSAVTSGWAHVVVARVGAVVSVYVNGVGTSKTMSTGPSFTTQPLQIGQDVSSSGGRYVGYLDDIRFTKGSARYTGAFTPPSQAFADNASRLDPSAPGRTTTFTYDASGRVLSSTDSNNKVTTYSYYASTSFTGADPNALGHFQGDLQSVTNSAGHVTQYTQYDKAGRVRQMVDAKGITTDISYTPRGWVSSVVVTPPGGNARTTTYTYDFVGQLTGVSNPDGTSLAYAYDAAHRLTGVTDARGNSVTYTLDNAGNRTAEQVKDPSGTLQRAISRSFDALNRVQQTVGAAN